MKELYNKGRPVSKEEEDYIKSVCSYDATTGVISRTDYPKALGSYDKDGYLIIKIRSRQFKAHRLAWFLYYGHFPSREIDHINRNRSDNRICNLREVNRTENVHNVTIKPNPRTGVIGVYIDTTKGLKKNFATKISGKSYRFRTLTEAIKFRKDNGYAV